jgi:hypothetical protein
MGAASSLRRARSKGTGADRRSLLVGGAVGDGNAGAQPELPGGVLAERAGDRAAVAERREEPCRQAEQLARR